MNRLKTIYLVALVAVVGLFTACIEDDVSTNVAHQPQFSTDTLDMGLVFTQAGTPTHSFTVYNRYDKVMSISNISLRNAESGIFRLNVDGFSGKHFENTEIRPNDSIFVFVEATLPENGGNLPVTITDYLDFETNGVTKTVVLSANGQDVDRRRGQVVDVDTRLVADKPYQIFDSLVVAEGATLTLDPGVTLYFHDGANLVVHGRLISNGTVENKVNMTGDRTDNVLTDTPFDLMSGQWSGVEFTSTSQGNYIAHTSIRNTVNGVIIDSIPDSGEPAVTFVNSVLRNAMGSALTVRHAHVKAVGCEIADAGIGVLRLIGGNTVFNHCTFANYYLFSAPGDAIITMWHINPDSDDLSGMPYAVADFSNCIIYGNGNDLSHGDLTDTQVTLRCCSLKSAGEDDANFIACLWDCDPLFYTVRSEYVFDYRLKNESPAVAAANSALTLPEAATDWYGLSRGSMPDLGAYVYTPAEEEE